MITHRALSSYAPRAKGQGEADLLRRHGSIVDRLARRITLRTGLESAHDDLWSAGAVGLFEAAEKFDPSRGTTFEVFADKRVRGAMLDELRRLDHLPRRLRAQANDVATRRRDLSTALGRAPTPTELAADLDVSMEELGERETLASPHVSLDWAMDLCSSDADDPTSRIDVARALTNAVTALPERLRMLLGLIYTEDLPYGDVAALLQISKPRVCQLHADALARLRTSMKV